MPHFPKPFFRSARNAWFVQVGDRQIKTGPLTRMKLRSLPRVDGQASLPAITQAEAQKLVVIIVDEFLDWCQKHRAPDTYRWYKDRLNSFVATIDPALTADQFKPHHVQKWVDNYARRSNPAPAGTSSPRSSGDEVAENRLHRPFAPDPHEEARLRPQGTGRHAGSNSRRCWPATRIRIPRPAHGFWETVAPAGIAPGRRPQLTLPAVGGVLSRIRGEGRVSRIVYLTPTRWRSPNG